MVIICSVILIVVLLAPISAIWAQVLRFLLKIFAPSSFHFQFGFKFAPMYRHESVLKTITVVPDNIDFCVPIPFLDRKFFVRISGKSTTEKNKDDVFTDGSKSKEEVGRGIPTNFRIATIYSNRRSRSLEES